MNKKCDCRVSSNSINFLLRILRLSICQCYRSRTLSCHCDAWQKFNFELHLPQTQTAMAELKSKGKRRAVEMEADDENGEAEIQAPTQKKKNRQRVLLLSSRGVTHRMRHLMNDLEALLPHVKKGMCPVFIFSRSPIEFDFQIRNWTPNHS